MTKILIVEDDAIARASLYDALRALGYAAIAAVDASSGLALALQEQPDAIFCDLILPDRDGYSILRAIRCQPALATTPFIAMTGCTDREHFRQAMLLGADDYLTKPFTLQELLDTLKAQLQKRQIFADAATFRLARSTWLNAAQLRDAFLQAVSRNHHYVPLLVVRLDRFHELQQHLSAASLAALQQAAVQRFAACAPTAAIAHLDSDRFALLGNAIPTAPAAVQSAEQLLASLNRAFFLDGQDYFLSASIGIAAYPHHATGLGDLLARAERACQLASQRGGSQYQVYAPDPQARDRLALETQLRYALERGELVAYYQPRVDLASGRIAGCEALVRWQHPERGLLLPKAFIPLAEETGLIVALGERVLRLACQQGQAFQAIARRPLQVAVNFSSRQFSQPDFCLRLHRLLSETGFAPHLLELELTESTLIQDRRLVQHKLRELRRLGVQIAIDDFGTGYSSLSYLQQFHFDRLKIDRSFTCNLAADAKKAAIAIAIIQMACSLNLRVTAEGVETEAELDFLYQQACHEIQGYCFSPALPADEFSELLRCDRCLRLPGASLAT